MNNIRKRAVSLIISLAMCLITVAAAAPVKEVTAASKYIKMDAFIKYLVTEVKLPVDMSSKTPYIDAAMKAGILKEGDFKDYTSYLTRTDCAVLANRTDELINGTHYGYTAEVYEFLKGCEYLDGKLYYNMKGSLYPEGESIVTYNYNQFFDEIVWPRLEPYFTFKDGLRADYFQATDGWGNVKGDYIMIGLPSADKTNQFYVDPFKEDDYLIQAWQKIIDGDRKVNAVYNERICDLNKITKSKRQDVAEIFAKGIIKGYSNGQYIQNRAFKGSSKITSSGAKSVVTLVLNPSKRALISPDGQLIRTTNLPKNANKYPYILECFPNSFYEMPFEMIYNASDLEYKYPVETTIKYLEQTQFMESLKLGLKPYEYYDTIITKATLYMNTAFNIDYRTVGKQWIEYMASAYAFYGDNLYDNINGYVAVAKKNHLVVESSLISVEPSTMYVNYRDVYIRAYVRYRITADTINVSHDNLLYSYYTDLVGLKNGEWRYCYFDIQMNDSYDYNIDYLNWGIHAFERLYEGTFHEIQ